MDRLFPALERRFNSASELKRLGRKLYQGFQGRKEKSGLPFVEVTRQQSNPADTFGKDLEVFDLVFTCFTSRERYNEAAQLLRLLERRFSYCNLQDANFATVQVERGTITGPFLNMGTYMGTVSITVTVQWSETRVREAL